MKILLISAPKFNVTSIAPLGVGYIASILEREGYKVDLLPLTRRRTTFKEIIDKIDQFKPEIIGHTVLSCTFLKSKTLISNLKKRYPQIIFMVGGPHPTALPEHSLKNLEVEFGAIGQGEITALELVQELARGGKNFSKIRGLVYKENNQIIINKEREFLKDLDSLPFPAWHLMPPKSFPPNPPQLFYKRYPTAQIITSRGCKYKCRFCASPRTMGTETYTRSAENVVDEMEWLVKDFQVKEFQIFDQNLTYYPEHVYGICKEIIKRELDITWKTCNGVRIDKIDPELFQIMKESGGYLLNFGMETTSQRVLDRLEKELDTSLFYQRLEEAKKLGMETMGFFTLGLPGEKRKTVEDTINFAKSSPLDFVHFSTFIPLPGAPLWDEFAKDIDLDNFPWGELNYYTPNTPLEDVTPAELKRLLRKAYLSFYFNKGRLIKSILRLKLKQIPYLLGQILDYLFLMRGRGER